MRKLDIPQIVYNTFVAFGIPVLKEAYNMIEIALNSGCRASFPI